MKREKLLPSAWPLIARLEAAERRRRNTRRVLIALAVLAAACLVWVLTEFVKLP